MKTILLTLLLTSAVFTANINASELFTMSSKERGITAFDYVVTEVARENGYSTLNIPGFQQRSAPASRWMMCVYTELAIERKSTLWAAIYNDNTGDTVTVVFPQSDSLDDPAFANVDALGAAPQIMSVINFIKFCGLN
ncbi:hypothetical protein [Rheinheimera oceanensis]|uniref:hypothetical protein n=1 Tax=Rheinheimera oceanensis TaxID=2817449 RepID=UPI001BFECD7C|nr:hypothetical protein [Rheinheimera oceanensis]